MLQQIAHAKINLALQVMGKRDDGYHLLNTLVCFTEYGDRLSLEKISSPDQLITLEVIGPFADELGASEDNLVLKAARILATELDKLGHPCKPAQITLEKNLPISSGIGGGSADAAATIRLLKEFWNVPASLDLEKQCLEIGADVPMCFRSKPMIVEGIGEVLSPVQFDETYHVVLVNPRIEISTPAIFSAFNHDPAQYVGTQDFAGAFNARQYDQLMNDLQDVAMRLNREIVEVHSALAKTKPIYHAMSGSGATCFGLYENEEAANEALVQVTKSNPQYWAIATTTIAS